MKKKTNNPTDPFDTLMRIAKEIKASPTGIKHAYRIKQAYNELLWLDLYQAPANQRMYKEYLLGIYNKKQHGPGTHAVFLHHASIYFDRILEIAEETGSDIDNPEYLLEAAHTYGELSDYSLPIAEKLRLLLKAEKYVKKGLELFDMNKKLLGLADSLEKKKQALGFDEMYR